MTYSGLFTALITPFKENKLDVKGLIELIELQKQAGVQGLVLLGSTGETPTLSHEEQEEIIKIGLAHRGNLKIFVGTGSYSTQETIENTKRAENLGADCALIVSPYYNRPTQEGLYRHFETVAKETTLPILLYNVVSRTACKLESETIKRLSLIPTIVGVKECSSDLKGAIDIIHEIKQKRPDFTLLCGDDGLSLPVMALGGDGLISVISNFIPEKMVHLIQACLEGDFEKGNTLFYELYPLLEVAFVETNPIAIKAAMQFMGLPSGDPRLPLTPLSAQHHQKLQKALAPLIDSSPLLKQKLAKMMDKVNR